MSMTPQTVTIISLTDINIGERLRKIDTAHAEGIAESIRQCGRVVQPISVRKEKKGDQFSLIGGAHRIEAARLAGLDKIPAFIHEGVDDLSARLMEIDENLCRHELNALDRAVFLAERQTIYEELHPNTKAGVAGANARFGNANDTMSFASDVAEKIGLSARSIQRSVRIYTRLSSDLRERLALTSLANKQGELLELSNRPQEEQLQIVDALTRTDNPCKSITEALKEIHKDAVALDPEEAMLQRLKDLWERVPQRVKNRFITHVNRSRQLIKTEV